MVVTAVQALPTYGPPQVVALTGLNNPHGVAVDFKGDLFVADCGANAVLELPKTGPRSTLSLTGLKGPESVAVDRAGDVYVADTGNNRVVTLPVGAPQATLDFAGLNQPKVVAVDGSGNVFVADTGNDQLLELPPNGPPVRLELVGLSRPSGIAVDSGGGVTVADIGNNRVVRLPKLRASPRSSFRFRVSANLKRWQSIDRAVCSSPTRPTTVWWPEPQARRPPLLASRASTAPVRSRSTGPVRCSWLMAPTDGSCSSRRSLG
ncbi:MAG: hypothetical protein M3256_18590 [Actinomycetota bacterium]|nr:hypothetical protein [Actinomycetota bacterium]